MKNSPLNNIFSTASMGGFTNNSSGNLTSMGLISSLMGKSSRKLKPRVKKLENQVGAMIRKQNQGPTEVQETLEVPVEQELSTVPSQIGMEEEAPELLANNPTIASPFSPATEQMAGGMFGEFVPDLDGRDMGEEEIYS